MKNTHEMSWEEAKSYARRQVNSLRAFEKVEAVLDKALQAERMISEAAAARIKAEAERDALLAESETLYIRVKKVSGELKVRVKKAETQALKVAKETKENFSALLAVQNKEFDTKQGVAKAKLDTLNATISDKKIELAKLDTKVADANMALEALRSGLAGLVPAA